MLFSDICIEIMEAGKDTGHEQTGIDGGEFYLLEPYARPHIEKVVEEP